MAAKKLGRSDALGVAVRMENEGIKFYTKAARAAKNAMGKKMFRSLAKDEERHALIFRQMAEQEGVAPTAARKLRGSPLYEEMSAAFRSAGKRAKSAAKASEGDVKAIDIALEMEQTSYFYYIKAAESLADPKEKKILQRIAEEENDHFRILNDSRLYFTYPEMWHIIQEKPLIDGG